jgi:hypothetical protein
METRLKSLTILLFFIVINIDGFSQTAEKKPGRLELNRQIAKDYFLCECTYHGFDKDSIFFTKDHSMSYYNEAVEFSQLDMSKVNNLAKLVASKMQVSDYTNKKAIMATCLEYYNGQDPKKELEALIKSFKLPAK